MFFEQINLYEYKIEHLIFTSGFLENHAILSNQQNVW